MADDKPLPKINGDNAPFWEGCQKQELRFQQCDNCGHVRWPPADLCPRCHARGGSWIKAGGTGKIYTFAVYHTAFHPGFSKDLPYTVAVVKLDEGPHLLTNIVDCPPDEVHCDMAVKVTWETVDDQVTLPKFRPFT